MKRMLYLKLNDRVGVYFNPNEKEYHYFYRFPGEDYPPVSLATTREKIVMFVVAHGGREKLKKFLLLDSGIGFKHGKLFEINENASVFIDKIYGNYYLLIFNMIYEPWECICTQLNREDIYMYIKMHEGKEKAEEFEEYECKVITEKVINVDYNWNKK